MEYLSSNQQTYRPVLARRCLAALVDYTFYFVLLYIYVFMFGPGPEWSYHTDSINITLTPGALVGGCLWFVLFILMEGRFGYTLGKGLFDVKVVRERQADSPYFAAFKRHFFDMIDFFLFGLLAILLVKFSKEHKRLGDMIAHTQVVRDL